MVTVKKKGAHPKHTSRAAGTAIARPAKASMLPMAVRNVSSDPCPSAKAATRKEIRI